MSGKYIVGKDASFGGVHVSGAAQVNEPTTNNQGTYKVQIKNNMNIGNDMKVGGTHVKNKAIVTRTVKVPDPELPETDKIITVKRNLKIGGEHACDDGKILTNSQS